MKITEKLLKSLIIEVIEDAQAGGEVPEEAPQQPGTEDATAGVAGALPKLAAQRIMRMMKNDKALTDAIEKLKGSQPGVKAQFLAFLSTNLVGADLGEVATAAKALQAAQAQK
jgi:hypothetical protein